MVNRTQKARLGVFVLVAMVLLLAMLITILGSTVFADLDKYEIRYNISVSGLEVGAPVKYNGVRVGRVERIWIDPDQVSDTIVSVSLQKGTPIKENARAVLNVQGLTGLRFIELVGGTSEARTVLPGATIRAGTSVVDKLTGQAEQLSIKAELLINNMLDLTGNENRALVADVLERTGSLMNTVDKTVNQNTDKMGYLLDHLGKAANRLTSVLEELRLTTKEARQSIGSVRQRAEAVLDTERISALLGDARAAVGDLRKRLSGDELGQITQGMHGLIRRLDSLVEKVDLVVIRSREDLRLTLRHLAETTENLRDFSRLIREDPSRLLRSQERRGRELP